jgi:hypothetical protein
VRYLLWCSVMAIAYRLRGENALDVLTLRIPEAILFLWLGSVFGGWLRAKWDAHREERALRQQRQMHVSQLRACLRAFKPGGRQWDRG